MTSPRPTLEQLADQSWLVAMYVWGELSAEEAAAFEAQLANSPQLCELVAEEALMFEAIRAAESLAAPVVTSSTPRCARPTPVWTGQLVCVAASVLVLIGAWWAWIPAKSAPAVVSTSPEVLDAWSALGTAPPSTFGSSSEDETDGDLTVADSDTGSVPDWLLAAVAAESSTVDAVPMNAGETL